MRRKLTAVLCISVLTASVLAGCGKKQSETTAAETTKAAETTTEAQETETEAKADDDQAAADHVAELIDAIYVQTRNDQTDEQCKAAKEAWDALTDALPRLTELAETAPPQQPAPLPFVWQI